MTSITITKSHQQPKRNTKKYEYLRPIVNENNEYTEEIQAKSMFNQMRNAFCGKYFSLHHKIEMLRCYVFSMLLYGMKTYTLKKVNSNRLEVFEMCAYRRILKVHRIDKLSSTKVLKRIEKEKQTLSKTVTRYGPCDER